jgi:hypothetical protein
LDEDHEDPLVLNCSRERGEGGFDWVDHRSRKRWESGGRDLTEIQSHLCFILSRGRGESIAKRHFLRGRGRFGRPSRPLTP